MQIDFTPFWLSLKLAFFTTIILFLLALPLAWWLSQKSFKLKPFLEAIIALPIVLPPSVLGFYILLLLSPNSAFGAFLKDCFDVELLFSFWGLVVASIFYSFPFMLQPLQSGFESLNKKMIEASYLSGKGSFTTLFQVALPNMKPALLTAIVVTFAHTVGEFGVVLMVGGSLSEETKVASIAIYEMVETLEYKKAWIYSLIMLAFSFMVLLVVYILNYRHNRRLGVS